MVFVELSRFSSCGDNYFNFYWSFLRACWGLECGFLWFGVDLFCLGLDKIVKGCYALLPKNGKDRMKTERFILNVKGLWLWITVNDSKNVAKA